MKDSQHYGDLMNWVVKVINSCETLPQLLTARKLVDLFDSKVRKDPNIDIHLWRHIVSEVFVAYDKKEFDLSL